MSTSAEYAGVLGGSVERRFYPRIAPSAPIYIAFDTNNQGLLLNIGENGLLVSTPLGLPRNFVCRVSLALNGLRRAIQVNIRVVWMTESNKRAGIQILDLSEHDREQIRKWAALERQRNPAVERSASHEETGPSQRPQTEQRPAVAECPETFGSAPNVRSREPGLHGNACTEFTEPATSGDVLTGSLADMHSSEAAAREAHDRISRSEAPQINEGGFSSVQGPRRNTASKRLAQVMWAAAIAVLMGLGLLLWRGGPLRRLPNRSGEAATENNAPAVTDPNTAAKQVQNGRTRAPVARPEKPSTEYSASLSAGDTTLTRNLSDRRDAVDTGQKKNISAASSLDSASNRPIQNVTDGEGDVAKTASVSSSKPPEQPLKLVVPETSGSQITESPATNRPAPNPAEKDTASDLPVANHAGNTSLADVTAPVSNPPRSNDRSIHALPGGVLNPVAPPAAAYSPAADRPTSVERKADASGGVYMDVPEERLTRVTPPKSRKASFVSLPGERMLVSSLITMHIQRSVLMQGEHIRLWWPLRRSGKDVFLGELVSRVDPEPSHQQTGSRSAVSVRASVDKDGQIEKVIPVSGSITLLPNVVRAVRQWRYEPTLLDGKPVETEAYIVVEFHPTAGGTPGSK
jgi:hypothetical protein